MKNLFLAFLAFMCCQQILASEGTGEGQQEVLLSAIKRAQAELVRQYIARGPISEQMRLEADKSTREVQLIVEEMFRTAGVPIQSENVGLGLGGAPRARGAAIEGKARREYAEKEEKKESKH